MQLSVANLDTYMRQAAALTHEVVELPPFTLFFNPHDALRFFNYARPNAHITSPPCPPLPAREGDVTAPPPSQGGGRGGGSPDLAATLAALREAFEARHRLPRFEFIAESAPELPALLQAAGFAEEARNPLMVCTRETFCLPAAVPDLEIITLTADSPLVDLRAAAAVQACGFGNEDASEMSEAEGERQRARLSAGAGGFLARLAGVPVAAADFTVPLDGFTELVGIATLAEYRRRGIASVLTARAVEEAFAREVTVAFLGAEDERAGRVYERVGFRPYATALAYAAA